MPIAPAKARPLSPHLTIWKWGPHMLVSILHRVTGSGMATLGALLLVWWFAAAAAGEEAYATFLGVFTGDTGGLNVIGYVIGIGLTWSFFQHMANGIRHLFLDIGANYELTGNKLSSIATMVFSVVATVAFWAFIVAGR